MPEWKSRVQRLLRERALLVGVGNPLLGDDGVGVEIIRRISYEPKLDVGTVPENYLSKVKEKKPRAIIIVDAVDFGGEPGEVRLFKAAETKNASISTHALPLRTFASFFNGVEVWLLGIQPKSTRVGDGLSLTVQKAAEELLTLADNL